MVCSKEKAKGNKLLAPMASVILSAVNSDITVSLRKVSEGWTHEGQDTKVICVYYSQCL